MKIQVEYIPIESVKPYARNAKKHDEEQIEQIKNSIQAFGFNDPIAIWHGEIVEGHGRILAAKELGIEQVPVIHLDNLTDEQRKAYALAHNKLTMNTGFDFSALESELDDLSDYFDMADFGFEEIAEDEETNASITNTSKEYDPEEFGDEQFECECPRCGFKFNRS